MPQLTPPEAGVCNTTFELDTAVAYSSEPLTANLVRITVNEIDLTTRLSFDIYTRAGSPQKLRDHEEAHRQIGEYYYSAAAAVAERIARPLIGETFIGSGNSEDAYAGAGAGSRNWSLWRYGADLSYQVTDAWTLTGRLRGQQAGGDPAATVTDVAALLLQSVKPST